jgi:DNA polymerase-1
MLIQTREEFLQARTTLLKADVIAVDTETNWTDDWDSRELMGISFYCRLPENNDYELSFYFPFRHNHDRTLFAKHNENLPYGWLRDLACVLERSDCIYVGHGFKFDFKVLEAEGIFLSGKLRDTLILSWMDDENKFSHELDSLAKLVNDKKDRTELKDIGKHLGGWEKIPPEVMEKYACGDTRITFHLHEYFWPRIVEQGLEELYDKEERRLRILTKIEQRGVQIDKDTAVKLSEEARRAMQETLDQFGYDPGKPSQLAHRLFASETEGGLGLPILGPPTKRKSKEFPLGLPNMSERVLSRLNHPEALRVLDYRSWQKANSTWYEGWFNKVTNDSRIHPEFKQHGTVTTRLSCTKPNMQQIPRDIERTPVKSMLRAKEGYELWEFDYSQVEFRLGAIYAECTPILEAYKTGVDVHQLTSDRLKLEELTGLSRSEARYAGKQTNFLTIYGGGPEVLRMQIWRDARLDLPLATAEEILDQFHRSYPEWRKIMRKCEGVARTRGYVKMWNGRRRHFDVVWKHKDAFNSVVQGGCAQIIFESMEQLDDEGFEIVSQVHDSLWIELPIESSEADRERVKKIMEWPGEQFEVPFPVDEKRLA